LPTDASRLFSFQLQFASCSLSDFLLRDLNLFRHIEILLRNPTRRVSAQAADDFRVPYVNIGMVIGSIGRLGHGHHEVDAGQELPELESLGDDISAPAPAREIPELSLNRNVG
jgi:hypothetical protein